MADAPVLSRLKEIEGKHVGCVDDCDEHWLIRLNRALLESQGELMEEARGHACCKAPSNSCSTCNAIARAERVRKGEIE